MVTDDFRDFVLEQLRRATPLPISHRPMFGAVGVYGGGAFFAIIDGDEVYLKADDDTRPAFEERGAGPFLPYDDPDRPMRGYMQLPGELLDDPADLAPWVDAALGVARRAVRRRPSR